MNTIFKIKIVLIYFILLCAGEIFNMSSANALDPSTTITRNDDECTGNGGIISTPGRTDCELTPDVQKITFLRLDLLLNNFIIKALTEKKIDIFESFHRRSFIHISDIANSFNFAIKNINIMKKQAFNVGDESLNFTKLELANQIKKIIDCEITEGKGRDSDQRDYVIDFKKINKIGFKCAIDLENGIKETADAIKYLIKTGEFEKFRDFYKNI